MLMSFPPATQPNGDSMFTAVGNNGRDTRPTGTRPKQPEPLAAHRLVIGRRASSAATKRYLNRSLWSAPWFVVLDKEPLSDQGTPEQPAYTAVAIRDSGRSLVCDLARRYVTFGEVQD